MTAAAWRARAAAVLRRPEAALLALVLGACAYFYQAGGWNQNSRFDLTRAIVEDGSLRIDRFEKNTGDDAKRDGHHYCDKAPGVSWLGVPPYALAHALAGPPPKVKPSTSYLAWSAWAATVVAVGLPSAIAAVMLALYLRALGLGGAAAAGVSAAWALATLAWPYGTLLYGHQTLAALLIIGFALVATPRARGEAPSAARLAVAGLVLGYAVVVEYPAALACAVIGGYAIAAYGWRRALWIVAGAVPPAIALAAYHAAAFGGPATLPYEFSTQPHRHMGWFMGLGTPRPEALWHILLSSYRGLLFSAPWLALAIPGGVLLARAGRRLEVAACAAIVLLFVWLNSSLVDWQGGWTFGARYLVPCVPFLVVLAAGVVLAPPALAPRARQALAAVALALVAWSFAHMAIATTVKPEVPVYLGRTKVEAPFSQYLYRRFADGALSVSTQSIDMPGHPDRGPRHAWNLGHKLGLTGHASLAPLALWMLACGALIWTSRASRRRG